jgi:hypothetical protein
MILMISLPLELAAIQPGLARWQRHFERSSCLLP